MRIQTLVLSLTLFSSVALSSTLIDVVKVAGKNQSQVAELLGQPTNCTKNKYGQKCSYSLAETEIVFINGKADWITIEGIDNIPFDSNALESIGIPPTKPSFKNNTTLRWSSIQGLKEVLIFKGATNSDYAYIKAFTK
ncbi:hypothetical protein [Shewanella frigidimarina]|uniref:Lipoprotein n=1 Tax=Shewanella frigidimarina TaxID=56812 RepID=A0A106BYJ9_SHEFR|nr:hypothetical protein [Shewanella frigidimarina]KVX00977.1 hypothetical protein AWJ07_05820 [Shewanella frigidimarina]